MGTWILGLFWSIILCFGTWEVVNLDLVQKVTKFRAQPINFRNFENFSGKSNKSPLV